MKKLLLLAFLFGTGCTTVQPVHTVLQPLPPQPEYAHKSNYRKTIEVLIVGCGKDGATPLGKDRRGMITIVESTATGERFNIHGCMGREGDRFKIAY